MTARRRHRLAAALGSAAFVAGGCAVDRLTAVELIASAGVDAGGTGGEGSIDGAAHAPINGAADAPSDGVARASSEEDGSDGGPGASSCASPVFDTSSPLGIWPGDGVPYEGYFVFNNMWNTDAGLGPQTLSVCSYNSWYVVSDQTDNAGAVKTYPNAQMNFNEVPIASLHGVMSRFAETSPHVGVYDDAYDIWLNGIATAGSTEIMVWVDNYNQVPKGSQVTTKPFGDRTYDVWMTPDSSYIALVSTVTFTSGTVDLLEIFSWAIAQNWLPQSATLDQIDFGVEIVSTGGANATYQFNDFSITTN
jgi:Glycosyl hydrolase family 12